MLLYNAMVDNKVLKGFLSHVISLAQHLLLNCSIAVHFLINCS